MFSLTIILVILTSLISYQALNNPSMKSELMFYPVSIKNSGQYYRFLSSGLIHKDMNHLFVNMFVLYIFGKPIERELVELFGPMSPLVFLLFYLSAIVISSIPSYFRHQDNPGYGALGASGATSALVFAYVVFDPWGWFIIPPLPGLIMAIGYLWYSSYMDKRGGDNIGHNAHFWGAVYGLFFILISIQIQLPEKMHEITQLFLAGPQIPSFLRG